MRFAVLLAAIAAFWVQPASAVEIITSYDGEGIAFWNRQPAEGGTPEFIPINFHATLIRDDGQIVGGQYTATRTTGEILSANAYFDMDNNRTSFNIDSGWFSFFPYDGRVEAYEGYGRILAVDGSAVPEPATWALLLFGFAAVGGAMRRRRPQLIRIV